MSYIGKKFQKISIGFALGCGVLAPAYADDIEIYTNANLLGARAQPNVMFVMDSSWDMSGTLPASEPYDYTRTYDLSGGYLPNKVYYTNDGTLPKTNGDYFDWAANHCLHSLEEYDPNNGGFQGAFTGSLYTTGMYLGQVAQFYNAAGKLFWRDLVTNNATTRAYPIECVQDHDIHGQNGAVGNKNFIANSPDTTTGWVGVENKSVAATIWANNAQNYTLFSGNYLNYLKDPTVVFSQVPLFDQLKNAIGTLVASVSNINMGLMQYDRKINVIDGVDYGGEGGPVIYPTLDVNLGRQDFYNRLGNMQVGVDSVISETYFEALKYFGGAEAHYGTKSLPSNQVGSMLPGNIEYETPITETCQKNYIIVVSNGQATYDYLDASKRSTLAGFDVGSCNTGPYAGWNSNQDAFNSDGSTIDNCLDELADWAHTNDVATRADTPAHVGDQNITTYTVGFAFPAIASQQLLDGEKLLRDTAFKGGGRFAEASNEADLVRVLNELVSEILKVNSTFSSPAVSVNAFNRATNLDDLFFTLFKPADGEHWEGNLKKFKLEFDANRLPFVADKNHNPAIDAASGFFKDTSVSYWTAPIDAPDGAETAKGGAASNIAMIRKIYTFTGSYSGATGVLTPSNSDLTSVTNRLTLSNTNITDAMLGGLATKPPVSVTFFGFTFTYDYKTALILWSSGYDIKDVNTNGNVFDARREMGDPLHAEPALVQYGQLAGGVPDLVAYVATNDGYLHAFNTVTGKENFAFVPQEILPRLQNVFDDTGVTGKAYGLDGNVISWINDANHDGTVSGAGEHVYLYFGMRRGGRYIYSLDVTNRNQPKLRWVIEGGTGDYAELGQTWSSPNVERIKIGGTERVVLIFGAGYDVNQDLLLTRGTDTVGRGIYIVDATTGEMLWRAGPDGAADLQLTNMLYSIPGRIKPIDIDGDGYVDRLYAGDMGGQLWRIDIDNNATGSTVAAKGGRIADLAIDGSVNDNRRFYNPPDVAIILEKGQAPYIAVLAASGYRAHPLQTATHDRAYMIRDYDVYTVPASYTTLTEADLFDTTDNLIGQGTQLQIDAAKALLGAAKGWYITFREMSGAYVGEKALSESLILNNVAIFTTFIPAAAGLTANTCKANDGTGAIYYVNIADGTPTDDGDTSTTETREDRRTLLARGGIPPTPRVIITEDGIPTLCVGTECSKAGEVGTVERLYWYEVEQ
ncbi:MAG: PilC/PilY family type IV pilus protein [Gammaproteobacteria bacterium]|nr:PilC/PilY family type IV pilus protein [Gammaproteobacteria bacterium]